MIHLEHLLENHRIALLFMGFIRQELTEDGARELDDWISESKENEMQFARLTDPVYRAAALSFLEQLPTRNESETRYGGTGKL